MEKKPLTGNEPAIVVAIVLIAIALLLLFAMFFAERNLNKKRWEFTVKNYTTALSNNPVKENG